jgi:hypothetical protein
MENEGPAPQQPNPAAKSSSTSAFEMDELMSRISRLEQDSEKKHRLEDRVLKLENTNETLRSSVEPPSSSLLCLILLFWLDLSVD